MTNFSIDDYLARRPYFKYCRKNRNAFIEYVMRDQKGRDVSQGQIHALMQWHIKQSLKEGYHRIVITAAVGHGKSEQIAVATPLAEFGEDQNIRTKIITATPGLASKRVQSITRYIDTPAYSHIYPEVSIDPKNKSSEKFLLYRNSKSSDPSLESYGVGSSGEGSRSDLMIFDDVCDLENSLLSEVRRQKVYDTLTQKWINRLEPDGILLIVRTPWHKDDAIERLLRTGQYSHLKIPVSEKLDCYLPERNGEKLKPIPLWSFTPYEQKWNKKALQNRKKEIGEMHFNRAFLLQPFSIVELFFKHFEKNVVSGVNPASIEVEFKVAGVDISSKKRSGTVISVIGITSDGKKVLVDGVCIDDPAKLGMALLKMYVKHRLDLIYVENNAIQDRIVDEVKEVQTKRGGIRTVHLPVTGYHTGSQKYDLEQGLPQLGIQFENDGWIVPKPSKHDEDTCDCFFCKAYKEFKYYPYYETDDIVMATWLAERALTEGLNISTI